jgi:hypothetical protein
MYARGADLTFYVGDRMGARSHGVAAATFPERGYPLTDGQDARGAGAAIAAPALHSLCGHDGHAGTPVPQPLYGRGKRCQKRCQVSEKVSGTFSGS